jgi:deoxyhypusine synthase
MNSRKNRYLRGTPIATAPITGDIGVTALVDRHFQAYNSGRLREACQLFAGKMLEPDVTVGMSLTGALTPAGLGGSCIVPLIECGFVDWIVSTGANLYRNGDPENCADSMIAASSLSSRCAGNMKAR